MQPAPRVPFDVVELIAAARCEVPLYYRKNDVQGPVHLDVAYYPPTSEWTAVGLLLASRMTHRAASRFSWACVRVSTVHQFDNLIQTLEERHVYPGEPHPMGSYIRTLELGSNGREDWSVPQLFGFGGENVPNLQMLVIPDALWCVDLVQSFMRLQEDFTPFPFPSLFPTSLDTLLLTSTARPVSMAELTIISIMAPNLARLQVTAFDWRRKTADEAHVLAPSYRFRHLEWLSVGATLVAGPDEPSAQSSTLSNLLDALSRGSGMPRLKRLDILSPVDIPRDFSDFHADTLEVISILSTKRPTMQLTPALRRFRQLNQLVIVLGSSYNSLPLGHPTLRKITFSRPPLPHGLSSEHPHADLMRALNHLLQLLPYYPAIETVTVTVENGNLPWLAGVERSLRERGVVIRTIVL